MCKGLTVERAEAWSLCSLFASDRGVASFSVSSNGRSFATYEVIGYEDKSGYSRYLQLHMNPPGCVFSLHVPLFLTNASGNEHLHKPPAPPSPPPPRAAPASVCAARSTAPRSSPRARPRCSAWPWAPTMPRPQPALGSAELRVCGWRFWGLGFGS